MLPSYDANAPPLWGQEKEITRELLLSAARATSVQSSKGGVHTQLDMLYASACIARPMCLLLVTTVALLVGPTEAFIRNKCLHVRDTRSRGRATILAASVASSVPSASAADPLTGGPGSLDPLSAVGDRDDDGRVRLKSLSLKELEGLMRSLGEDESRAAQLWRWMYNKEMLIGDLSQATRRVASFCLSTRLRDKLDSIATVDGGLRLEEVKSARDGTRKMVMRVIGGPARGKTVESVIIPMVRGPQQRPRYTLCVSSQSGCAMACDFCHTGKMGLLGSLTPGQIVEQLVLARRYLRDVGDSVRIERMVFMGMGEPFDAYDSVVKALEILTEQTGKLLLGPRKITVSTVGLVDRIDRFCAETKAELAVSLHATTDEIRSGIMPVNRRYNLEELMDCLRRNFAKRPSRASLSNEAQDCIGGAVKDGSEGSGVGRGKRVRRGPVALEYVLLRDINDSLEDAERLADMTSGLDCVINLIHFNTHDGAIYQPSTEQQVQGFRDVLRAKGRLATVRDSKGDDEMSACGQLGDLALARRLRPSNS